MLINEKRGKETSLICLLQANASTHFPSLARTAPPGQDKPPAPFTGQGTKPSPSWGLVNHPLEHLFLCSPCRMLPSIPHPPDLLGQAPFQPPPLLSYPQPSLIHTKITFLLWPGLCFPGQYIMPLSHSPPCPIWLPSYPHKDY